MLFSTFVQSTRCPGPAGELELACALPEARSTQTHQAAEDGPEAASPAVRAVAIICHPHPLFGGSMQNKVVTTLERSFRELGAATLRFNFRGIGASQGSFDHGNGEAQDLLAVHEFVRQIFPDKDLWLAGFSFGSFIAAKSAQALQPARLISVAPPVQSWDFSHIARPSMPWLIVQGDADEVVDPQAVYRYAEGTHAQLQVLEATHFFHGKLLELRGCVQAWLQS